jgi:ABC-type amino acid transport substrate-binding protein
VRKDLAAQDVNRPDVKIGVRAGTTSEAAAASRLPKAQIVAFPTAPRLYAAVKAGEVDGALAYTPRTTIAIAESEGKLAVATGIPGLPHTVEAFAVRKGEQSLLNYLNAWDRLLEGRRLDRRAPPLLVRIARLDDAVRAAGQRAR